MENIFLFLQTISVTFNAHDAPNQIIFFYIAVKDNADLFHC